MKINITTSALRDGLSKVLTVVDRKNSRPILTNSLISFSNDSIELLATDLEVASKVILTGKTEDVGKFCINTKNLFDILRELPDAEIEFKINQEKNILNLTCQNINYSLLITNAEEFPQINFENSSKAINIKSQDLQNIINKTSHAVSNDETRINLNGVYFQEIDNKLRAVAIDGHRLALLDVFNFDSENQSLKDGIIVPKKGITELKKLADVNSDAEITLQVDESFLYAKIDNYMQSIRLIAREYPKYQTVIPSKTSYSLALEKEVFLNAVKRIKLLSNEKTNGIKIFFNKTELKLTADHPSLGQAKETIQINYDGPEIEIGFNARYMIDTLNVLDVNEITFEFNNELSPVIVKSGEEENFLGIVMPLKI